MRVHVVNVLRGTPEVTGQTLDRIAGLARTVEEKGFHGLWVTDSFGRGRPTLDPVVAMSVIATVTRRIEIGTCVLQVPVRHPVELAHRIQSLHALTGDRLMLGLGSGSTQADFDLVGEDYTQRFKSLMPALDTMRRAWRGEQLEGGTPTPWPGTEGGPAVLLGAWPGGTTWQVDTDGTAHPHQLALATSWNRPSASAWRHSAPTTPPYKPCVPAST